MTLTLFALFFIEPTWTVTMCCRVYYSKFTHWFCIFARRERELDESTNGLEWRSEREDFPPSAHRRTAWCDVERLGVKLSSKPVSDRQDPFTTRS